ATRARRSVKYCRGSRSRRRGGGRTGRCYAPQWGRREEATVAECAACGGRVEESFRFCPWCASPQRLKLVEFFRGHAVTERDRGKALRVSRYLGGPERHVRFSVWRGDGVAEVAVSVDDGVVRGLWR